MSRSKGKNPAPRRKSASEQQRQLQAEIKHGREEADAFRVERERLRLAERAGRVGVFDWDLTTGEVFSTGELEKLFGLAQGALGGRYESWARLVHPEDLPRLELGFVEWLQSGRQEHRWEYRLVRPDGEVRWLEARAELVRDEAQRPRRIVGANVDITERRQIEQAHRESEERYRSLLELAPDVVMVHQEGRFVYVNAAAVSFFGAQSVAELLGRPMLDLVSPEEHAVVKERAERVLQSGGTAERRETHLVRLDGQEVIGETAVGRVTWMGQPAVQVIVRDVSARKRAEAKLRESEARFRSYAESTQDVIWIADPTRQALEHLSPAFERVWGRSREGVRPQEWLETIHEADRAGVLEALRQAQEGCLPNVEYRIRRPDGQVRWIADRGFVIRDETGAVRCVAGIARDITERKRAEEALRASEERFRLLAEAVPEFIWSARPDGVSDYYNPQFLAYLGKTAAEMEGWTWVSTLHPEDQERGLRAWRETLASGNEYRIEFRIRRGADGSYRWFLSRALPLRGAGGQVIRWYGIVSDIDDHRRGEETLRRSQAGLAQAIRVAGLGTFEHDHQSDLIECSAVLRQMYGFGPDEPVTLAAVLERVPETDREPLATAIRRAHDPAGDGMFEREHRILRSNGGMSWVSVRSQTFFEGQGSERRPVRTIGAVLDVTERKESQTRLERLVIERTAKLEEMVAELEHMSHSMVHSMRAPLRAILSFAELIERREGQRLRSDSRELFARMGRSIHQMDQLITDTLNYNKAVRSRLPLGPTNVGELLQGLLRAYAEFQPPQTEVRLEGECPWVLGNESGLTQCFSELLRNAVKFVRPGTPPRVKVWAEVLRHAPAERAGLESGPPGAGNKWVRIWVEDNGTGIPQEGQARIFEMFQRMHGSEYEGTGIGLALVRKLVERMGGHIGVESVEGQGSRFWMELKAAEPLDRTD